MRSKHQYTAKGRPENKISLKQGEKPSSITWQFLAHIFEQPKTKGNVLKTAFYYQLVQLHMIKKVPWKEKKIKIFFSKALDSMTLINRSNRQHGVISLLVSWKDYEGKHKCHWHLVGEWFFNLTPNVSQRLLLKNICWRREYWAMPHGECILLAYLNSQSYNKSFIFSNALACIDQGGISYGLKYVTN